MNGNSPPGAGVDLVAKVQDKEDGQGDVSSNEVADVPVATDEDLETVGKGEDAEESEEEVAGVRLEDGAVRQSVEELVVFHSLAEADIGRKDDNPGDVTGDGGNVHEPREDLGTSV